MECRHCGLPSPAGADFCCPGCEAVSRAIEKCGRPMVLSLSPGAAPLAQAEHLQTHANLWRISDDFRDDWEQLKEQFERLREWNPERGAGHWPDAGMLPFGADPMAHERLWAMLADVTRMGEWSPECRSSRPPSPHTPPTGRRGAGTGC